MYTYAVEADEDDDDMISPVRLCALCTPNSPAFHTPLSNVRSSTASTASR
jgi:hypothetical protein